MIAVLLHPAAWSCFWCVPEHSAHLMKSVQIGHAACNAARHGDRSEHPGGKLSDVAVQPAGLAVAVTAHAYESAADRLNRNAVDGPALAACHRQQSRQSRARRARRLERSHIIEQPVNVVGALR